MSSNLTWICRLAIAVYKRIPAIYKQLAWMTDGRLASMDFQFKYARVFMRVAPDLHYGYYNEVEIHWDRIVFKRKIVTHYFTIYYGYEQGLYLSGFIHQWAGKQKGWLWICSVVLVDVRTTLAVVAYLLKRKLSDGWMRRLDKLCMTVSRWNKN